MTARPGNRSGAAAEFAAGASMLVFVFLAGSWAFTSYYLRYLVAGVFVVVAVYAYRRVKSSGFGATRARGRFFVSAVVFGVFAVLDVMALASHVRPAGAVDVSFPLSSGTYYVMQGGNSVITNPFHAFSGTPLALDIGKLGTLGNRAGSLAPRALEDYRIFGETIYSPCAGTVLSVRDTTPDNPPGTPDTERPANRVALQCAEVEVIMDHLMRGSALIAAGKSVALGQPLARVGNSGNTLEPHLHIGARRNGVETGLTFGGKWLSMNSIVASGPAARRQ